MFTIAEVEAKHEDLKRQMRKIRRAMRTQEDADGLAEQLELLTKEARSLVSTLERQRQMTYYLLHADSYGGPQ